MWKTLKEKRDKLRLLRVQKIEIEAEIKTKRASKKTITVEMAKLRAEVRWIKGIGREW